MKPLTDHQRVMLRTALASGCMTGGRYGWNTAHVRALAARGLVVLVREATWDSVWKLTDAGRAAAQESLAAYRAAIAAKENNG